METNYLDQLNGQQRDAVEYLGGPELVIAGAGSGKTRVLTYKIVHLLAQGLDPRRILALTFTNKAAREMRERIRQLVDAGTAGRLWMGTFHSVFLRILRTHATDVGFRPGITVYDAADARSAIKMVIRDLGLDETQYKPSTVANAISWAKNALISPEAYASNRELLEADRSGGKPQIYEIYRVYRDRSHAANAMDFDDLLFYTNVLLRDHPDIARHYSEYFQYVLVDEYQDTNFAQHLIVRQLAGQTGRLCVVGDDAQSIYSFRGANIRNILDLEQSYPGLRTFKLERNYRSTQNIVDCAGSLIAKNTQQMPKNIYSEEERGPKVDIAQSYSDYEEAFLVANRIAQVKMGTDATWDEFAVLYRTNAQSRILEDSLRKRNIPYRIYGGLSFYQRKEIKDAVAYMRLALNPADDEALRRVINFPARGIGDTTLQRLSRAAMDAGVPIWNVVCSPETYGLKLAGAAPRRLDDFRSLIEGFHRRAAEGADAYTMATDIVSRVGLISMLVTDRTPESISKQENLQELLSGASSFVEDRREERDDADVSLGAFMDEVSLATDVDTADQEASGPRVTLMTMHAAKGLEFTNVFIVGAEEDLLPNAQCQTSLEDVEEERRLFYVAITRARHFCMISFAKSRYRWGMTAVTKPSRFLMDLNPKYINLVAGTTLGHQPSRTVNFGPRAEAEPQPRFVRLADSGPAPRREAAPGAEAAAKARATMGHTPPIDKLAEGVRIEHNKFGEGTIVALDVDRPDPRIVVEFDTTGRKTLLLRFAHFKLV